jgi:hypothetical protein
VPDLGGRLGTDDTQSSLTTRTHREMPPDTKDADRAN